MKVWLLFVLVLVSPAVMGQVPGLPPIKQLPDAQAVREVDGALQLGAAAANRAAPRAALPAPAPVTVALDKPPEFGIVATAANAPLENEDRPTRLSPPSIEGRPPAPGMTLRPGRNAMITIARTHLNRLITPFPEPVVKSTAVATTTSIEGSVVYVATESTEPVSLFVMDANDPVNAMSLTLVPRDIPAVQVSLELEGYLPRMAPAPTGQGGRARTHLDQLRDLMRALAQGGVPSGYAVSKLNGRHGLMPECVLPGIQTTPAQLVSGANVSVVVVRARNVSTISTVVDEQMCSANRVLAVAAWPRRQLEPGQETEIFIALKRQAQAPSGARPSTLTGRW